MYYFTRRGAEKEREREKRRKKEREIGNIEREKREIQKEHDKTLGKEK